MVTIAISLLTGKKIYKFKANKKNVKCPYQFCLGNISNKFNNLDVEDVSLKGNVYEFSVD